MSGTVIDTGLVGDLLHGGERGGRRLAPSRRSSVASQAWAARRSSRNDELVAREQRHARGEQAQLQVLAQEVRLRGRRAARRRCVSRSRMRTRPFISSQKSRAARAKPGSSSGARAHRHARGAAACRARSQRQRVGLRDEVVELHRDAHGVDLRQRLQPVHVLGERAAQRRGGELLGASPGAGRRPAARRAPRARCPRAAAAGSRARSICSTSESRRSSALRERSRYISSSVHAALLRCRPRATRARPARDCAFAQRGLRLRERALRLRGLGAQLGEAPAGDRLDGRAATGARPTAKSAAARATTMPTTASVRAARSPRARGAGAAGRGAGERAAGGSLMRGPARVASVAASAVGARAAIPARARSGARRRWRGDRLVRDHQHGGGERDAPFGPDHRHEILQCLRAQRRRPPGPRPAPTPPAAAPGRTRGARAGSTRRSATRAPRASRHLLQVLAAAFTPEHDDISPLHRLQFGQRQQAPRCRSPPGVRSPRAKPEFRKRRGGRFADRGHRARPAGQASRAGATAAKPASTALALTKIARSPAASVASTASSAGEVGDPSIASAGKTNVRAPACVELAGERRPRPAGRVSTTPRPSRRARRSCAAPGARASAQDLAPARVEQAPAQHRAPAASASATRADRRGRARRACRRAGR